MNWTYNDLDRLKQKGMVKDITLTKSIESCSVKKSKYGNKTTYVEDHRFDSQKEAARRHVLRHWQSIGAISDLRTQVEFELNTGGTHSLKYIADFTYTDNVTRQYVVEDSKGAKTVIYKKKKKLMKKLFKIEILET